MLKGYREERGLLWPDYDRRCAEVTFRETEETLAFVSSLPRRRSCIQAGGNCGQLIRGLAPLFEAIYTFEPDYRNFVALAVNTAPLANVFRFQAALSDCGWRGARRGMAGGDAKHPDDNCGALYMTGDGLIPSLTIDDLGLKDVDLILLDVEGGEFPAMRGGYHTIRGSRPVIIFENKNLGQKFYGEPSGGPAAYLIGAMKYKPGQKIRNDTVMVPA